MRVLHAKNPQDLVKMIDENPRATIVRMNDFRTADQADAAIEQLKLTNPELVITDYLRPVDKEEKERLPFKSRQKGPHKIGSNDRLEKMDKVRTRTVSKSDNLIVSLDNLDN